jgi:hypothetical protein
LPDVGEQVAGEVDPAALVPSTLETAPQGLYEAGVLVADHELHPSQATALQAGEEARPERLVLAVADVDAQDLSGAVRGDASRDHDGHRQDLPGGVADVQVGRVEIDIGELDVP